MVRNEQTLVGEQAQTLQHEFVGEQPLESEKNVGHEEM